MRRRRGAPVTSPHPRHLWVENYTLVTYRMGRGRGVGMSDVEPGRSSERLDGRAHDETAVDQGHPTSEDARLGYQYATSLAAETWENRSFWPVRLLRAMQPRHAARVDIVLPRMEVELARRALEMRRWHYITSVPLPDQDAGALAPTVMVFIAHIPSGDSRAASRLSRDLAAALQENKIKGLASAVVDSARPTYRALPEWRPRIPGAENTYGSQAKEITPDGNCRTPPLTSAAAKRLSGVRIYGPRKGAQAAWKQLQQGEDLPQVTLVRAAPLAERLRTGIDERKAAVRENPLFAWMACVRRSASLSLSQLTSL